MRPQHCLKTSGPTKHPMTRYHISEERRPQDCAILKKTHIFQSYNNIKLEYPTAYILFTSLPNVQARVSVTCDPDMRMLHVLFNPLKQTNLCFTKYQFWELQADLFCLLHGEFAVDVFHFLDKKNILSVEVHVFSVFMQWQRIPVPRTCRVTAWQRRCTFSLTLQCNVSRQG
jgi:hypothetical protein